MSEVEIEEVGINSVGHLFVRPPATEDFTFIWRDAYGVRWNEKSHSLVAYEPHRWEHLALFQQMITAVKSEYGRCLVVGPDTRWSNIPSELRSHIEHAA